ncbi:uncharacterized protein UV8b_00996 [Ustilaginoidea virens]|uniref:Glucose receptor Git3-like N-terminal domain-containing protein n=1 Tax=Ustilaginoidea virens TaxID=1159556 RepID=A0A8E5HK66_USTVR|nr:uncharacterized protein UV8b_00996 [Ustilaginoidea virens]QUC16755.1 hypothetical protein UV8b_00996 [Ustilaginoidea virens]
MLPRLHIKFPIRQAETSPASHKITQSATQREAIGSFAQDQLFALRVSSVAVGSLSLLSTMVAVAFFLLMQRSFRHDLILLLILSDTLKTLWLVIPQAMELAHGNVSSTSTICQISGFFLSVGIEACDLAVLLMAAHTALYILRGRSGLYPYRYLAYILVAAVSLMLASLAFINQPAFFNSGPYCYLPHQPGWTSRALSWIPRYVIIAAIMLTYTFIYVYVTCVLKNFEKGDDLGATNSSYSISRPPPANAFI